MGRLQSVTSSRGMLNCDCKGGLKQTDVNVSKQTYYVIDAIIVQQHVIINGLNQTVSIYFIFGNNFDNLSCRSSNFDKYVYRSGNFDGNICLSCKFDKISIEVITSINTLTSTRHMYFIDSQKEFFE
jgi:hypothetical protein